MIVKWPNNRVWWSPRGPVVILLLLAYMVLSVDSAGATALSAPRSATLSHVVRPGETLSAIAAQYGLTEAALAQANGIANPSLIYAGQQLVIPASGGAASPATVPARGQAIHVVQRGEALSAIGQRYGVTEGAIAQANGLANPNLIYAGQQLVIPASGGTAAPPATATGQGAVLHVVQPGQTLSAIAAQYGVSEPALAQANGIANPGLIFVGQQLVIPAGGGTAAPPSVAAPRAGDVAELAAIVYAEAQASPIDFNEMLAVASVIRNRVEHVAAYPIDRILVWWVRVPRSGQQQPRVSELWNTTLLELSRRYSRLRAGAGCRRVCNAGSRPGVQRRISLRLCLFPAGSDATLPACSLQRHTPGGAQLLELPSGVCQSISSLFVVVTVEM